MSSDIQLANSRIFPEHSKNLLLKLRLKLFFSYFFILSQVYRVLSVSFFYYNHFFIPNITNKMDCRFEFFNGTKKKKNNSRSVLNSRIFLAIFQNTLNFRTIPESKDRQTPYINFVSSCFLERNSYDINAYRRYTAYPSFQRDMGQ